MNEGNDTHIQEEKNTLEELEQRDPGEVFDEAYLAEPTAAPLWKSLERWGILAGLVTGVLSAITLDFSIVLGWTFGWWTFLANVMGVRRITRWLLSSGRGAVAAVVTGKMLLLLGVIWIVLSTLPVHPAAFGAGYATSLAGLVVGTVVLALRAGSENPESSLTEATLQDENPGLSNSADAE